MKNESYFRSVSRYKVYSRERVGVWRHYTKFEKLGEYETFCSCNLCRLNVECVTQKNASVKLENAESVWIQTHLPPNEKIQKHPLSPLILFFVLFLLFKTLIFYTLFASYCVKYQIDPLFSSDFTTTKGIYFHMHLSSIWDA